MGSRQATNVLWIMADQLRFDYLSCYGHPTLETPHVDGLARRGVRFDRAYVQSPFCGPSRASFYTGRYVRSHGSAWNNYPLRVGEPTLGDHLRPAGVRVALVGKTHVTADTEGMARLGIDPHSTPGTHVAQAGFEPYERDDGLHPAGYGLPHAYDAYLRARGFDAENPWEEWANSGEDAQGNVLSGWLLCHGNVAARVPEQHSETPYMTRRAMAFIEDAGEGPWLCHLSYIKPHWPYIAPAPYHDMYGPNSLLPVVRSEAERHTDHPVFRAFIESRICRTFARDEVRERVVPAYMGLVKQLDDHLGVLFRWMEERGLFENTMIIISSDHGDYLGDHWMGEKDLFHEPSVRTPLIVYDPRPQADGTRGTATDALVEGIDLVPTFLDYYEQPPKPNVLEGRSLEPLLHRGSDDVSWRRYAISEYDYATRPARLALGIDQIDARLVMACDDRYKYVYCERFRPMLFDLANDPEELEDLGDDPGHEEVRERMKEAVFAWSRSHRSQITMPPERIDRIAAGGPGGIVIGVWDEEEYERDFGVPFAGRA